MGKTWIPTDYPGVYYRLTKREERVLYAKYAPPGRGTPIIEKVGVWGVIYPEIDEERPLTPAIANQVRSDRMRGRELPNKERREAEEAEKAAAESRWTFTRLWDDYKSVRYGDTPPLTEKANWKNHLSPLFGEKTPDEISTIEVERMKSALAKKGLKPGTVAKVTELLRRLINWGVDREYFPAPAVRVKLPRVPLDREPEFLSDAELSRLLGVLDAHKDVQVAAIVRLALLTGMRRSEILRLEWDHVDLERGYLRITQAKGGTDETIPLSDAARAVLKSIPRTPDPEDAKKELPLVFPGRGGKKRADVNKDAKAIKTAAKLPEGFRLFHGSRHHFASTLASGGVDLYTVGRLLTHKSPQMTKRYSHLSDAALRAGANIMGQSFTGIEKEKKEMGGAR